MPVPTGCLARMISLTMALLALPAAAADFTVSPNTLGGLGHYVWNISIEGDAIVGNPPLYVARGGSYTFDVSTSVTHPFWIKSVQGAGTLNGYNTGVSANGVTTTTTVTFDVPADAPDTLFYDCSNHAEMTGPIHVVVFRNGFD